MIKKATSLFMAVTDAGMYFYGARILGVYFLRTGVKYLFSTGTLMVVTLITALLMCVSYLGTWITLAERRPKAFLKWFLLLDACPGILGALSAMIR
jgi:hypothetical protein